MSFTGKTETYLNTEIANDGFFPAVKVGDFQRDYNIPAKHELETVSNRLRLAMMSINEQLATQKASWFIAGHSTLADVPAETIDTVNVLVLRYFEAVLCYAKSLLIPEYAALNRKDANLNLDQDTVDLAMHWKQRSYKAIKKLTGKPTSSLSVELL